MESHPAQPLKVCPRCSTASRTDAERCPDCGRRYQRHWRLVALGLVIVALAFAIGFEARLLLDDDDGSSAARITVEQAQGVPLGISRAQLAERLGASPTVVSSAGAGRTCLFYPLSDDAESAWEFCFDRGALKSSKQATGE
jgi:hypothetical protein